MAGHNLVLISGGIAAGKTTTARGLADLARKAGMRAMAIDMDEMIEMVAGTDWSSITREQRRQACRLTGALVDAAFTEGTDLIAIAGSTLLGYEWDVVTSDLVTDPSTTRVLLRVTLEESIRRAQQDPARLSTRDPVYVEELAAAIDWRSVPEPDLEVHTDGMTSQELVDRIAEVMTPRPHQREGGCGEGL